MPDTTLSLALQEAYASATQGIIYHTIELMHPEFTEPIRVVRDYNDLTATLEASAPNNPSESVTFTRFQFDLVKPEVSSTGVPQATLIIDNVDRSILANVEASLESSEVVQVIYREFISTDLSAPQNDPPTRMHVISISANIFRVTAVVGFPDLINRRFPTIGYDSEVFPGLSA